MHCKQAEADRAMAKTLIMLLAGWVLWSVTLSPLEISCHEAFTCVVASEPFLFALALPVWILISIPKPGLYAGFPRTVEHPPMHR